MKYSIPHKSSSLWYKSIEKTSERRRKRLTSSHYKQYPTVYQQE